MRPVARFGRASPREPGFPDHAPVREQDVPKSVKALRRSINVAFIAALIEAIEWPDTNLCRELFRGFRTAGDLRDQDSGVFRPSDDISELVGAHWQRIPLSEVPSGVGASHAALAPARDLESWRRGFIVSPQARRPSSFAELSFPERRDHVLKPRQPCLGVED